MPKHSPGPWGFEGPDDFGDYNILQPGISAAVAAVVSNLRPPEEILINARLVAAAPQLLEALATSVAHLLVAKQDIQNGTDKTTACRSIDGAVKRIRDIIALVPTEPIPNSINPDCALICPSIEHREACPRFCSNSRKI